MKRGVGALIYKLGRRCSSKILNQPPIPEDPLTSKTEKGAVFLEPENFKTGHPDIVTN